MKYKLNECIQCSYKFVTSTQKNICPKCYSDNLKVMKSYKSLKLNECIQCSYKFVTSTQKNICPKCYSDNLKVLATYKSLTEYDGKEDVIKTPIYKIINGKIKCNSKSRAYEITRDLRSRKMKCDWYYHIIDKCYYVEIEGELDEKK